MLLMALLAWLFIVVEYGAVLTRGKLRHLCMHDAKTICLPSGVSGLPSLSVMLADIDGSPCI